LSILNFFKNGLSTEQKNKSEGNNCPMPESSRPQSPLFPFEAECTYDVSYYDPKPSDNGFLDLGYAGSCTIHVDADGTVKTDKDQFTAKNMSIFNIGEDSRNPSNPYFAILALEDRSLKVFFRTLDDLSQLLECLKYLKRTEAE